MLKRKRGVASGSAEAQAHPAARLRMQHADARRQRVDRRRREQRKPELRVLVHRHRDDLDVRPAEPLARVHDQVADRPGRRERPAAEQIPLQHGQRRAVEAQKLRESELAAQLDRC